MQTTSQPGRFAATRWTLVLAARGEAVNTAMAELCGIYWYPLYAFARRTGHNEHDARDLTQGFFMRLLSKNSLAEVDRSKGRFRSFLLAAFKHFVSNERNREQARKRGGAKQFLSLDSMSAETRYSKEPADFQSPDKLFDRQWALTILDRVLAGLRTEFTAAGKTELFEALKGSLTGDAGGYARIGAALSMSEGAVKVAVHRMRKRYRELLREEIAQTVATPDEVDEEIRALFSSFSK